ncbi:MAG: para-aminobenzoate synthase component 1 [Pseudomonadota bacterium]
MHQLPRGDLLELFQSIPPDARRLALLTGLAGEGFADTLAWDPVAQFEGRWSDTGETLAALQQFITEQSARGRLLLGFLSYELGHQLQHLPLTPKPGPQTPDYCWLAYDSWLTSSEQGWAVVCRDGRFLEQLEGASAAVAARQRSGATPRHGAGPLESAAFEAMTFQATSSEDEYRRAYERIAEYIRAGDIYQVNLTHLLQAQTTLPPRSLFPFVARSNPVEHLAYLEGDGYAVHSASPERFVRVRGRSIETFPIKGTRPRGSDPKQDQAQLAALLESEKEAAELNMISDLLRNDLNQVCVAGSVEVVASRTPRAGPKVWHTATHISGVLKEGITALDALLPMLPGGSISGCPKRRALEIIAELEPSRRGVYTGVIGRIDPDGNCDFSVAIRTLIQQGSDVYLSVGGGIVYDSQPEWELEETRLKAVSFAQLPARLPKTAAP